MLLLLPIATLLRATEPAPPNGNGPLRLMTYNIHNGFDKNGDLNLEMVAQTIEASGADVIALQEVSRGWIVNGSLDGLEWLAARLDMAYHFVGNADPLTGLAILSRVPITDHGSDSLPPDDLLFHRTYLWADLNVAGDTYRLVNFHAHHLQDDHEIRELQVAAVLAATPDEAQLIFVGDFNAEPGSPAIDLLQTEGLVAAQSFSGAEPLATFPHPEGDRRLDYIWLAPELMADDVEISGGQTSDHLALTATISTRE